MKLQAAQKATLGLLAAITAAALCVLPFLAAKKDVVYVYAKSAVPDSREQGFVRELKRLGYEVKLNAKELPRAGTVGLWFKGPDAVSLISRSAAEYNFIYNEDYYPFDWRGLEKLPVVLTPYRELYEHYARANVKTALFTLGVNPADFFASAAAKAYPLIYYGDNNKTSPLAEELKGRPDVKFLGRFWENSPNLITPEGGTAAARGAELSKARIVAIYNAPGTPAAKIVPVEIMEAAAAGALVMTSPNAAVKQVYGDSVIISEDDKNFLPLISYYLQNPAIMREKNVSAQKITAEKLSSAASAKRFIELLDWLKNNS